MEPLTKAVMDCLKNVEEQIFTMKDLFEYHTGKICNRANVDVITKIEKNLYRKSNKDKLEEVEKKITKQSFDIADFEKGIVNYINKLKKENVLLVEKCNNKNKNLEQQLQFLQIEFCSNQQELINKICEIKKITKHNIILKSQVENLKKYI